MQITPKPHQIEGALFLAQRKARLLADEQRVGKTGASILACDYALAGTVLVVTTASARPNWGRDFKAWQAFDREVQVIYKASDKISAAAQVVVVGWGMVFSAALLRQLTARKWDVLILDESHQAKNREAKRTTAVYRELKPCAERVWCLSGTPIPNAPNDLYPMLKALEPERLAANAAKGWPDVSDYHSFVQRYCVVKPRFVNGRRIDVIVKGKNETELAERMDGFFLRRTQQDVGIGKPIFDLLILHADKLPADIQRLSDDPKLRAVLDAIETGERVSDDEGVHLAELRRITGELKAHLVVEAAKDMLDNGLDRIVLMRWHSRVGEILRDGLSAYGVVSLDGTTPADKRGEAVAKFQSGEARVFDGQITAAGEGIDLSVAAELWFVEPSFTPKDMSQAAMRITNFSQRRQALVRFCALENSIDEAFQAILKRKVATIKQLME